MKTSCARALGIGMLLNVIGCFGSAAPEPTSIEQGLCQNDPNDPCCPGSPIILDLDGDGFDLTDLAGGVRFDLNPAGSAEQVSWTSAGSDDAWLALDRNGNGIIDDGTELFGNFTAQPTTVSRHGYLALSALDPNRDDVIDSRDKSFGDLRLWQDRDHDGVSAPDELSTLEAHGILGLDVRFAAHRLTDKNGNLFRYSANVFRAPGSSVGLLSYDVFLITKHLDQQAREQGAMQSNGAVSMATVSPDLSCPDPGDDGDIGITDPSIFYQFVTIGGAICRAVCWAAGSAVCAAVSAVCAVGSFVTIGGLVVPCSAALIAACAAGSGAASICSDYVCPP
jgi:hypothetical protein